jgi:hypothetical protein
MNEHNVEDYFHSQVYDSLESDACHVELVFS